MVFFWGEGGFFLGLLYPGCTRFAAHAKPPRTADLHRNPTPSTMFSLCGVDLHGNTLHTGSATKRVEVLP